MMNESVEHSLHALRDVAGVQGSFALRVTGELVAKDLPAVFHDDLFVEVGARISRFVEAVTADGSKLNSATMRFDEHRLYLTPFPHGLLVVLTSKDVNSSALRMALTLTTRRIEPELLALLTHPPPPVALSASSAPPPVGLAGSHGVPRTYRGRLISG
jgi:predicted regulator of Ras-like GTPase activity (Roadblock/LC7/MglB family)